MAEQTPECTDVHVRAFPPKDHISEVILLIYQILKQVSKISP